MSQQSEERLESAAAGQSPSQPTVRILPFEPRQSDLQRAIQQRAQEAIDRERDRDREERKPKPLKWLIIAAIASLPAVLMFSAVDSFLRVFHQYMETSFSSQPQDASQGSGTQSAPAANAEPEAAAAPSEPGVVMLSPVAPQQPSAQPPQSADSSPKQ
jgi:hypothetical protein